MVNSSAKTTGLDGGRSQCGKAENSVVFLIGWVGALPVALDRGTDLAKSFADFSGGLDVHSIGPLQLRNILWVECALGNFLLEPDCLQDSSGSGQVLRLRLFAFLHRLVLVDLLRRDLLWGGRFVNENWLDLKLRTVSLILNQGGLRLFWLLLRSHISKNGSITPTDRPILCVKDLVIWKSSRFDLVRLTVRLSLWGR